MAKVKVFGTCRLCESSEVELQNSHIISEFLYKMAYDEKGRFRVFSEAEDQPRAYEQKGFREYLLCVKCEGKFSVWEKYVKELLFDHAPVGKEHSNRVEFSGVDFSKFKLFQMSLIWRMGISSIEWFENVDLGDRHAERLRDMLDRSDPGEPYEYACWMEHVAYQIPAVGQVILPPTKGAKKYQGHACYRTVLGGMFWCFFISSHMEQFPRIDMFLSNSGVLPIWKESSAAQQFLREMIKPVADKHASVQ